MNTVNSEKEDFKALAESTASRYRQAGRFVHGFVRGKLLHDPAYRGVLQLDALPAKGKIVDLGCGRGILLALLTTAQQNKPSTTGKLVFHGIELRLKDSLIARNALGSDAEIINANALSADIPDCQAAILLDVLMYMNKQQQETLLQRVTHALNTNGVLIIREANADAGFPFLVTWLAERLCAIARGHWRQRYGYRSLQDWKSLLEQLGFRVEMHSMSQGTPFANILYVARK